MIGHECGFTSEAGSTTHQAQYKGVSCGRSVGQRAISRTTRLEGIASTAVRAAAKIQVSSCTMCLLVQRIRACVCLHIEYHCAFSLAYVMLGVAAGPAVHPSWIVLACS